MVQGSGLIRSGGKQPKSPLGGKPKAKGGEPSEVAPPLLAADAKASLRRTEVHCTCGLISPYSGRDYVKSLRSSYLGLYPQNATLSSVG